MAKVLVLESNLTFYPTKFIAIKNCIGVIAGYKNAIFLVFLVNTSWLLKPGFAYCTKKNYFPNRFGYVHCTTKSIFPKDKFEINEKVKDIEHLSRPWLCESSFQTLTYTFDYYWQIPRGRIPQKENLPVLLSVSGNVSISPWENRRVGRGENLFN